MAKARNKKDFSARDDARFEDFLQEQFRQLRAELDRFEPARKGVDGKLLQLPQAKASNSTFWQKMDSWRYAIAASVLLAVAIPAVIQMNSQQREAVVQATLPVTESPGALNSDRRTRILDENKDDEREESAAESAVTTRSEKYALKKAAKRKAPAKEETYSSDQKDASSGGMAKREMPADLMAARPAPAEAKGGAMANEAESAPAPEGAKVMPAAPAASRAMSDKPAETRQSARSAPIADAQFKLKQDRVSEEEKAEMENLWKEFEKDPETFQQDKKRSARLKTLLARHDTKSRARRMKSQLAQ